MSNAVEQNRSIARGILPLALLGAVAGLAPIWAGPLLAIGIAGGIVVMFVILRNPRIGLLLIAATIPLEVAGQIGQLTNKLPLTIPKILTLLTLGAWFVHLTIGRARYRRLPWMYLLPAFWCAAIVSLIGAEEIPAGLEALFRLLTTCIFFFLIAQLADSEKILKTCLVVFLVAGGLASSYSIVQRYFPRFEIEFRTGWEEQSSRRFGVEKDVVEQEMVGVVERSSGVSVHSIILALNVSLLLAPAGAFLRHRKKRDVFGRLFWLALLAIFLASVVVTYARTGVVLILFCGFLMLGGRLLTISTTVLVFCIVGFVAIAMFAPERYLERVLRLESYSLKSRSIVTRVGLHKAAFGQFLDHPVLGVGYGSEYNIFKYHPTYPDKRHAATPHNAYLQVASHTGLIGLTILCLFFWKAYTKTSVAIRRYQDAGRLDMADLGRALNISMACFLLAGVALDLFDKGMPHAWLIIGLCAAYQILSQEAAQQEGNQPMREAAS